MKINIQTLGISESGPIVRQLNKNLALLSKNYPGSLTEADVKLRYDKNPVDGEMICEIYLKMSDRNIFVKQKGGSFESSVKKAILRLNKQIGDIVSGNSTDLKAEAGAVL